MKLHWGDNQEKVRVLLDTGCSIPVISQEWVRRNQITTLDHETAFSIESYTGQTVQGAGQYYTRPMLLQHRKHYSQEAFEVSPMETGVDIILPFWWISKHPPQGAWENSKVRFNFSPGCREKCTKYEKGEFSLSWDETVCLDPEARTIAHVSAITEQDPMVKVPEEFR